MPGLVPPDRFAALQQRLVGQTRERMLCEIDEAMDTADLLDAARVLEPVRASPA